jgi:glycosyltransferase involved in cell wall biosynthesis
MQNSEKTVGNLDWGINGRFLTQRVTGVQRYAYEIVMALDALLAEEEDLARQLAIRLIVPPGAKKPVLARIRYHQTDWGKGHAWDQLILPFCARAGLLNLGNFGPLLGPNPIVCIHDANVYIEPDSYSRAFRMAYRVLLPLIGRRARRIGTVSRFSAEALVRYGVCLAEKIFIAPNGHEHVFRWDASRAASPLILKLKRPFIMLLGSAAKHKNVEVILKQARALDEAGVDVVIVGGEDSIFAVDQPAIHQSNVHRAGYVSDDDLAALYQRALCLVFPSKTEGFGIPPLEAMASGCPVISSNAASLVEVGGEAVTYVDPDRGDKWREAIIGLAANTGLRSTMIEQGRKRAAQFSWRESARIYLEEILRLPGPPS